MSETISTKPYLIRAIYEWCSDNGYTPHIAVKVQGQVRVPMEFVRDGAIVLNISFTATGGLQMDNQAITFKGRFGGVSRDIYVPIDAVAAIYASENNQGMAFEVVTGGVPDKEITQAPVSDKPTISLTVISTDASADANASKGQDSVSAPQEKNTKENRKKPNFTVIK